MSRKEAIATLIAVLILMSLAMLNINSYYDKLDREHESRVTIIENEIRELEE